MPPGGGQPSTVLSGWQNTLPEEAESPCQPIGGKIPHGSERGRELALLEGRRDLERNPRDKELSMPLSVIIS